jgi:5-methylcytosine-specific restriction endonuclease McrA
MSAVVVLNASFEPLGVVPLKRAMVYLMRERAVIVEAVPGEVIRSAEADFPLPLVVQFREMIRVPYKHGRQTWTTRGVLERDRHRCAYCLSAKATTVDHILPKSRMPKGEADTWLNCVSACLKCNGKKANRTPAEAGMPLRFQPREVTRRDTLLIAIAETGANLHMLGLA